MGKTLAALLAALLAELPGSVRRDPAEVDAIAAAAQRAADELYAARVEQRRQLRLAGASQRVIDHAWRTGEVLAPERCEFCRYWPVSGGSDDRWYGLGGHNTDGSVSDCRRRAPAERREGRELHGSAEWPTTKRTDWCGDFEADPSRTSLPEKEPE